ncbi:MAG TPA: TolC family protein [Thermoanaerobaculia bacterium]|nr:TolC family protein [Thermoanaerobaculia bacterium]
MKRKTTWAAVALFASGAVANAAPLQLSLDEAVRRGLTVGEEIQLSASAVAEAEQQVRAARAAVYPQIDAAVNYNRTIRSPYSFDLPEGMALPFGQANTWIAQVTINQTLYAAGKIGAGIQIAKEFQGSTEANAREEQQTIALAIEEAYYDAALAKEMAQIAESSGRLMNEQLAHVRLLKQAGNASELDVLRVQVERENLQPEITAAQNARDVATLNLLRLVNLPADSEVELDNVLTTATVQPVDVTNIIQGAVERRPAVAAAQHLVNIRKQQVKIERADSLPTVGASATIGEQALPANLFPAGDDFNSDWSVGVGVRIPLFDGGRRKAEVRAAQEVQKQAELQLAQLREAVTLELEQQRRELARAAEQVGARTEAVKQAQHAYELTELSYRVGNATQLDLTNARAQLRQATGNQAVAVHDYHLALARLERAAGMPIEG